MSQVTANTPKTWAQPRGGVRVLAGVVIAFGVLAALYAFYLRIEDRRAIDYGEGVVLGVVDRMGREAVSPEWTRRPPYTINLYGPGFYWLMQAATGWGGGRGSLIPGRAANFVLIVLTSALVAGYVTRRAGRFEVGLFSALMYLTSFPVQWWSVYYRVDHLALLFAIVACVCAPLAGYGPVVAALALALGSLVKQTVVTVALPIGLFFLLRREFRKLAVFAGLTAGLGLLSWGILIVRSHGFYLESTLNANVRGMDLVSGLKLAARGMASAPMIVALLISVYLFVARRDRTLASVIAIGFVVELAVQIVMACKEGSSFNYFIGPAILGAILIGEQGPALLQELSRWKRATVVTGLIACGLAPAWGVVRAGRREAPELPREYRVIERLVEPVKGRPVIVDCRWMEALLRTGATPYLNDPMMFRILAEQGRMDLARAERDLRQGAVGKLVLTHPLEVHEQMDFWPKALVRAMLAHYSLEFAGRDLYVYQYQSPNNKQSI